MAEKREHPVTPRFKICHGALDRVCKFSSIIVILREIDNINIALWEHQSTEDRAYFELCDHAKSLCQLLLKIFWTSKDLNFHMRILKTAMKPALCMNYFQVELLLDRYTMVVSKVGAECLKTYAWFQNYNFIQAAGVHMCNTINFHDNFVTTSLKYSADTRYFALAIENYISAYDIGQITECKDFTFQVILTNLENSHENVHRLFLELFKRMMKCFDASARQKSSVVPDILHLSWTNRNKYQLLAIIVSTDIDILLQHKEFSAERFHEGIQVGLTMHNLYAPSQSLVKAMQKKEFFQKPLVNTTVDILWGPDDLLAGNLIKFWLSTFDHKLIVEVYTIMRGRGVFKDIRSTSPKYHRMLLLCNTFKRIHDSSELRDHVLVFATVFEDLPTKIEIFHFLVDTIIMEPDQNRQLIYIVRLAHFLRQHIAIKESCFVEQFVMRRLPTIFNLLASRKFRDYEVLTSLFKLFRHDIFEHGMKLGSYESITFSLKLLNVILKQYFSSSGCLLSKNTNIKGNLEFGKYLAESGIWDIVSPETFKLLIKQMEEDEHSDLSDLAFGILVEYYVKSSVFEKIRVNGLPFIDCLKQDVAHALKDSELSSNVKAKRYFALKFECSLVQKTEVVELVCAADLLKTQFMTIYREADPVKSMENGLHLFKIMDSVNYGLKRVDPEAVKSCLIPVLNVLLKNVALHFMNFFCDEKIPPSFELMDQKLCKLLEATSVPDAEELKPKLVLYVWFTLRSSSEISKTLAAIITKHFDHESKEFNQVMNTCLDVNIQILTRCCHKGVIDSASDAIGDIAKLVSKEYSNLSLRTVENTKYLHSFLVILKKEIFANKRPPSTSGDIRSSRGLITMAHKIISSRPPFLKFLMDSLLVTGKIQSFEDTKSVKFHENVMPIQLHLLAALIKDGELAEDMLKYLDFVLLATFKAYKASDCCIDYVVMNALLQIIGAIVPKIANQKRSILNESDTAVNYEPKAVTCYEFYVKFTYSFRIALFDLDYNIENLKAAYIIMLLEIFSNFEYRNNVESWSEIEKMRSLFRRLMFHEQEKIRLLSSKCYAQWHDVSKLLEVITNQVRDLASENSNVVHSAAFCIRFMVQRYESCLKSVVPLDMAALKVDLRNKISEKFNDSGFPGASTFFVRSHLLDFLLFVGFPLEDPVCHSLLSEKNIKNYVGYKPWAEKIKKLQK